ncbi:MAG: type II toxin-antitoxin system VapC family toxin [Geodermatophilaceae bacterium]|nr:type II toxin-antitoxin system VapC family toxin [Geodermatophilaceae bacterium]
MPTSARQPDLLVDTSAAIALVVADHAAHRSVAAAVRGRSLGLAGHAAYETFSVLTRLPAPVRRTPRAAVRLIQENFPRTRLLGVRPAARVLERFAELGISGGAVYDALVGATAVEHGIVLATRDRRALTTYRALDVVVEVWD